MKIWLTISPLALALPAGGLAQDTAAEDRRAAELVCEFGGVCGELAQQELLRDKALIEGVPVKAMKSVGEVLQERRKSQSPRSAPRQAVAAPKRPVTRNIPGRRQALALNGAAEVPASLAGRAPLMVTFELGSARLTPASMAEIRSFTKALNMLAAGGIEKRFRLEGHTDSVGGAEANVALSRERASAVRAALVEGGIDTARIEVTGLGESAPISGYDGASPLNRRVIAVEIE